MKKGFVFLCLALMTLQMTSCTTIVGGQITESQRRKPAPGEPSRQVKVGALIADAVFFGGIGIIVDFATGAIYKKQ